MPPKNDEGIVACIQLPILDNVVEAQMRHNTDAIESGRLPPSGFGKSTTLYWSHGAGMDPLFAHKLFHNIANIYPTSWVSYQNIIK